MRRSITREKTETPETDLILCVATATREQARGLLAAGRMSSLTRDVALVRLNWSPALDGASDPYVAGCDGKPGTIYAYLKLQRPRALGKAELRRILQGWRKQSGDPKARASRLVRQLEVVGASPGLAPVAHYVVEMDPEIGWADELFAWYDQEHMPGLAAVSGCIHAVRMFNLDDGPLNFACYDLTAREVMGCPPWLAVRHSAWSDRVRPHFTNARRTMFEVIG